MYSVKKASEMLCRYKYVLEMAPITTSFQTLKIKVLKKHKYEFINKKLDFFLSPYYFDDKHIYVQLALDFDNGFKSCKRFLRSLKNLNNFVVEITNKNKCHVLSKYIIKFNKQNFDIKEHRKQIIQRLSKYGLDKIASQNINPFRRFPSRTSDKKHFVYPMRAVDFAYKTNSIINREFEQFVISDNNFDVLFNEYVYNIKELKFDPEGIL